MVGATSPRARLAQRLLAFALAAALVAEPALAQAQDNPAAPAAPATTDAGANAAPSAAAKTFSRAELEKLLAPIALYPDPLLAQLLPASAYPVQIVQAQRWLDKNKAAVANNDYSGIDNQNWDPAVKALARFPDVIKKMSADLDWTTDLGDAEVNQPQDVADVIQELRAKAQQNDTLKTTAQQTVTTTQQPAAAASGGSAQASYIEIQPTDPATVYVPSYDPVSVYEPYSGVAPLLGFGAGIAVGALWNNNSWNWGTGAIYPPVWAGYSGWRGNINNGNVNIGNNVNVGNNLKPWRPNADYRPGMGSKPGIGANRPGGSGPGRRGSAGQGASAARASRRRRRHRRARGIGGPGRPGGIGGPGGPGGIGGPGRPGRRRRSRSARRRRRSRPARRGWRSRPSRRCPGGQSSGEPPERRRPSRREARQPSRREAEHQPAGKLGDGRSQNGRGQRGLRQSRRNEPRLDGRRRERQAASAAAAAASAAAGAAAAGGGGGGRGGGGAAAAARVAPICASSTISCCSGGSTTASAIIASSTTAATPPMSA